VSLQHKAFLFLAILGLFSLCGLILLGDNGIAEFKYLKEEHRRMVDDNESISWKNSTLFHEIQRLKEDAVYIENVARQQLGFIEKDEYIFKLNDTSDGTP
jgi:cell division protein FtsB